jgi:hypothetical protein
MGPANKREGIYAVMNDMSLGGAITHSPDVLMGFQGLKWDELVDGIPVGICACDAHGRLMRGNKQAELHLMRAIFGNVVPPAQRMTRC